MRKIIPIILIAILIMGLPACNKNKVEEAPIVAVNLSEEPKTVDPQQNTIFDGNTYIVHLFEGLTTIDRDLNTIAGVADGWDVSDDGLTYTFRIRSSAVWSDGVPVRAGDFVFAWKRLIDPATSSAYSNLICNIKNAGKIILGELPVDQLGVTAINDRTLRVEMDAICPYFLQLTSFPALFPAREDIVNADSAWASNPFTCIGNGPFTMAEWERGSYMLMKKNPNYWNADSISDISLKFVKMEDEDSAYRDFKKGDILFSNTIPSLEVEKAKKDGTLTFNTVLGTYYYLFNTQKKPFDDPRVRKALTLAVDRQFLIDRIFLDDRKPADALVPTGIKEPDGSDFYDKKGGYYPVAANTYDENVAQAQQLLADAGYPAGEGFPTIEFISNDGQGHIGAAESIRQMWLEKLGVNMKIYTYDMQSFQDRRRGINWDMARGGRIGEYADPNTFLDIWTSISAQNSAKFKNSEYDRLIFDAQAESNQKIRFELLHRAEDILIGREMAILPLTFYNDAYLISPGLEGVVASPLSIKYFFWVELGKKDKAFKLPFL